MTSALVIVLTYGTITAGGWNAVMDNAKSLAGYLSFTSIHDATTNTANAYGPITIISTLAWGLGYFGMPHILVRFMAIEDERKLVISRRIASIWVVIAMAASILIGIVGLGMSSSGALVKLTGSNSETIIVYIAKLISSHGALTAIIAGIILAGILAATMSTSDSQMLAAASSVSQNILQDFLHIKLSEKKSLLIARISIVCIAIIAIILARDPNSSVFNIVSFAWAGFGGAFGAVVLCSLFWKRCNLAGALSGMIAGGVTIFVWKYLVRPLGGAWDIYELLPAFIVSLLVIIIVSLLTKAPDETIIKEFEEAR
jgi:sodium/proline symporter